jgi:hypothetical protein
VIQNGFDTIRKGLAFLLGLKIPPVFPKEDNGASALFGHEKLPNKIAVFVIDTAAAIVPAKVYLW